MLEFSPDWDARACYLVVFVCALVSARVQVLGRLAVLKQKAVYAWGQRSTWLVYTIYLLLPLGLFWILDRMGALQDTALFAALLVGFAYPAILAGGTTIKPAGGLGGIFDWLNKAMDGVIAKTTSSVALEAQLFERVVVDHLEKNAPALKLVTDLALQYAASREEALKELAAAADPRAKAQIAFEYATDSAEGLKPLTEILPQLGLKAASPYARAKNYRVAYACLATAACVAIAVPVFHPRGDLWFRTWRIAKPGLSQTDLARTERALARHLRAGGARAEQARAALLLTLQQPGLDSKRADHILQLLVADRGDPSTAEFNRIALGLTQALRAGAVDIRLRVNHALLLLASEWVAARTAAVERAAQDAAAGAKPVEAGLAKLSERLAGLSAWKPLDTESPLDLERKWLEWREWWLAAALPPSGAPAA